MLNSSTKSQSSIAHIRQLLNDGRPHDALKFINHLGLKSPIMENARAVCLMRMGKPEQAISVLRDIVFRGYVCMPSDTPALYQANFAVAMLMVNQKDGAIPILTKLNVSECPQVAKLKDAVSEWMQSLNIFQKLLCRIGYYPAKKIKIEFPLGEI
ncbi:MAG: hypothetical protein PHF37_03550 [Phycisphaerae bacterium]|nr:hypothetical protein [Phycisphaerae bacterium]